MHPHDHDQIDGEYKFLTEPIIVTRANVRVRGESLSKILSIWMDAQEGKKHPSNFLAWMRPRTNQIIAPDESIQSSAATSPVLADGAPGEVLPVAPTTAAPGLLLRRRQESELTQDERNEGAIGWWDFTMDAAFWLQRVAVSPREAAMLLCQLNPNSDVGDPEGHFNGETGKDEYRKLLRAFDEIQHTQPDHRTLAKWVGIAQSEGLKFHSWIDEYMLAVNALTVAPDTQPTAANNPESANQAAPATKALSPVGAIHSTVPGTMPTTASGKCAVRAAWQIEQETGRVATVNEVMDRLMVSATNGSEPDLKAVGKDRRSVIWITDKYKETTYNKGALGKTLKKWNDGRSPSVG